jgi:signal transduction histidine kinase
MIVSDESLICLLMKHLVNNAVKFTKKGEIEIGCDSANNNMICFWVRDSGKGVSSLHHKIIFERFRQVDEMITRSFNGAGLGLSIAKGIAGLLGGDLRIESSEDEGAGFYFTLPVK